MRTEESHAKPSQRISNRINIQDFSPPPLTSPVNANTRKELTHSHSHTFRMCRIRKNAMLTLTMMEIDVL
jgi:hypothetical protein